MLREIRACLPGEDLLYVADSGHVPYGNKTPEFIIGRSRALAGWLLGRGCKALVIACNTATAAAAGPLREEFPGVPIIGMEPAVKPAAAATRNGVVGVLATVGMLRSSRFAALLDRFAHDITVVMQPAPGLVEQVEKGELQTEATRGLVEIFTRPLLASGVDTIVLGCTHFPFLRPVIADVAGPEVALIDTGAAVARHLARRLAQEQRERPGTSPGAEEFFTTGPLEVARETIPRLWPGAQGVAPLAV